MRYPFQKESLCIVSTFVLCPKHDSRSSCLLGKLQRSRGSSRSTLTLYRASSMRKVTALYAIWKFGHPGERSFLHSLGSCLQVLVSMCFVPRVLASFRLKLQFACQWYVTPQAYINTSLTLLNAILPSMSIPFHYHSYTILEHLKLSKPQSCHHHPPQSS